VSSQETIARLYAADVAARALGMAVGSSGSGHAVVTMTVAASMANGHGVCHGGLIFTLADTAFAYACNSHGGTHLAAHASIEFLAPARVGDVLTAEADENWRGGRSGLTDVNVKDQGGRLIAIFRGRSQRVNTEQLSA
jgi:acyl-CoA thioesterase